MSICCNAKSVTNRKKLEQAFDSTVRDFVPVATLPFIENDPQLGLQKPKPLVQMVRYCFELHKFSR